MKTDTDAIVCTSAALEGSTLTRQEVSLLLEKGVSTFGKTMQEQQLCLDLGAAYRRGFAIVDSGDYLSPYRVRELAEMALGSYDDYTFENEGCLPEVSALIRETRLHVKTLPADEMHSAAFRTHFMISRSRQWGRHSNLVGRLVMNVVEHAAGLDPTLVNDGAAYKRALGVALSQDICEVFVNHMLGVLHNPRRAKPGADVSRKKVVAFERKATTRETILAMLGAHPHMTTADLALALGITTKGVEKQLRNLKLAGALRRIGPDKGGSWEVVEPSSPELSSPEPSS